MEIKNTEFAAIGEVVEGVAELTQLDDALLAVIGGGVGEVIFH